MTQPTASSSQPVHSALLWAAETPACQAVRQSLATLFRLDDVTLLSDLKARMVAEPEVPVILIYASASACLQTALVTDSNPEHALRRWYEDAQPLVALHEEARRRVTLLDGAAITKNPDPFLKRFAADPAPLQQIAAADQNTDHAARAALMAQFALKLDPDYDLLANTLEAVTSCLPPEAGAQEETALQQVAQLLSDLRRQPAPEKSAQQKSAAAPGGDEDTLQKVRLQDLQSQVQKQNDALAQQDSRIAQLKAQLSDQDLRLVKAQSATEIAELRLADRDIQLAQQNAHIDHQNLLLSQQATLLSERAELLEIARQETEASRKTTEALRAQMNVLLEDMRTLHTESENQRQQLTQERTEQLQHLEHEIHRIMTSRSIKLTEPLRRLARLFSRG